jgi:hypothetical protein
VFLVVGSLLGVAHWAALRPIFAGTDTWPFIFLFLLAGVAVLAALFLYHALAPLVGDRRSWLGWLLLACVVALTVQEFRVNNRHRDTLVADLASPEPEVRWNAARLLAETGYSRAVPALIEALKDPRSAVRSMAAYALGETWDGRAAGPLAALLVDDEPDVRRSALHAMTRLVEHGEDEGFVPALIRFLEKQPESRADVLDRRLRGMQNDLEDAMRREKLGRARPVEAADIRGKLELLESDRATPAEELSRPDDDVQRIRLDAARLLNELDEDQAAPVIMRALRDRDLPVVAGGFEVVVGRGEEGSDLVLREALDQYGAWFGRPTPHGTRMAEALLNCGHAGLAEAAREWAGRHGYRIETRTGSATISWGGDKR